MTRRRRISQIAMKRHNAYPKSFLPELRGSSLIAPSELLFSLLSNNSWLLIEMAEEEANRTEI